MARKMTKLLRNIATAFSIIVASQVAASDSVVALVCNIEKPDYLVFLDFDKSTATVRYKTDQDDATYPVGSWTGKMISWSSFEKSEQSSCMFALDPQRMLLQNACFHHIQGAIAYSSTISPGQGPMRCAYVK